MSLILLFILLFFVLGLAFGPLLLAMSINALSADRGRRLGAWSIGLGLTSVYRPAITFNSPGELLLKRRKYDDQHDSEYIVFGGLLDSVKRHLLDPQSRIHNFYGAPFCFVDELFGIVIDPRDVLVGRALTLEQQTKQYVHRVERDDRMHDYVKAVFELERGGIGVDLTDVRSLVGGSIDAQVVDRIREFYRKGQAPKQSTTPLRQLLVPIGAFVGVVLLGWFISSQGGAGGGGGGGGVGPSRTIGTGLLVLLLSTSNLREDAHDAMVGLFFGGLLTMLGVGLYTAFPGAYPLLGLVPLPLGIWAMIMFVIGLVLPIPVAILLGRSLGPFGILLGKLYIIIGLRLGFDEPVVTLDDEEYRIREYDEETWAIEPRWYRFAMTRIGVGLRNAPENWPDGVVLEADEIEELVDAGKETDAPSDHVITDEIVVGDIRGYVPTSVSAGSIYVRSDRTTGWLFEAGQDLRLLLAAIRSAKQKYGGGGKPIGDRWILGATMLAMAGGAVFDWLVLL